MKREGQKDKKEDTWGQCTAVFFLFIGCPNVSCCVYFLFLLCLKVSGRCFGLLLIKRLKH